MAEIESNIGKGAGCGLMLLPFVWLYSMGLESGVRTLLVIGIPLAVGTVWGVYCEMDEQKVRREAERRREADRAKAERDQTIAAIHAAERATRGLEESAERALIVMEHMPTDLRLAEECLAQARQ